MKEEENALISIVVPTFNRASTIEKCLTSVIEQTYKNWELIVIDDGSADDTKKIVFKFLENYSNVKFIHRTPERQKGANACRNIGIELAKGEYIALLDSDDTWLSDFLESNLILISSDENISAIYGTAIIETDTNTYIRKSRQKNEEESYIDFLLSKDGFAPTPSMFFKKECGVSTLFDESLLRHQDWDFFIRVGDKFGWHYSNQAHIVVNRKGEVARHVHFDSCISFYEKYKYSITNAGNAYRYLAGMLLMAYTFSAPQNIKTYYRAELEKLKSNVGLKWSLITKYPHLTNYILKIKKLIGV